MQVLLVTFHTFTPLVFTLYILLRSWDIYTNTQQAAWVRRLSKSYPTLAFHASITNSFGKGSLIQLLRQFSSLHSNRKQISVGLIGYPNAGKSSIINTLRSKKVCTVAPIPGETKVWQYITLMRRIYLIDCPGIVPPSITDTAEDILLHGVVRVENVENPEQYIPAVLAKCKPQHIERTYEIRGYKNHIEFLDILAKKAGRLLKGGEPDLDGVAKMVLNDFIRGKLPWFTPVPKLADGEEEDDDLAVAGRVGKLGEMRKRKAEDEEEAEEEVKDDGEEWGGIQSNDEDGEDSDTASTDGAPTLVADDEEEEEIEEPVKPSPKAQRKRRKGN